MNADEKVNVTVQLDPDLLGKVDERADALDLNRSQYLRRLVRRDLGVPQPELDAETPKQLELQHKAA
jgi:predicted transcriptional regulator